MADLRLRSEDTTRKISQNKHSQAAAAHSSHRRRWRRINQTLLSELCGLEPREITLSPSAWLQDSGTGDRVAECIQCLWWCGVCRPLENTFCCNGYWHVSSEEPGHQLTAAKLARTISTPGWCRLCNEQQGSGQRRYVTSGDMETRIDMERRGWELETIYMYAWVQRCGGLATTLQSHT